MAYPGTVGAVLVRTAVLLLTAWVSCLLSGCGRGVDAAAHIVNVNDQAFPGGEVTVVTFNMLHGFGNRLNDQTLEERLQLLSRGILAARADIVILQEASLTPGRHGNVVERLRDSLNASAGGTRRAYNSTWAMANGSRVIRFFEGSGILSRFRILGAEAIVYKAQALIPPEHRIALRARVEGPRGEIQIAGTHLTNTEAHRHGLPVRTAQAGELAAWVSSALPCIMGGDFNSVPGSAPIRAMLDAGARDAWEEASRRPGGPGFTALSGTVTGPDDQAEERIDYIFARGEGLRVEEVIPFLDKPLPREAGGVLWASDHVGVLARIRLVLP